MKGKIQTPNKKRLVLLLFLTLLINVTFANIAFAQESLVIDIGKTAKLVEAGQAVELKVKVRCVIKNGEVLEAFLYVVQDGNQSEFAGIPVTCDDRPDMQVFRVRVSTIDFLFHPGEATASAFILVLDPSTGETPFLNASETIHIR